METLRAAALEPGTVFALPPSYWSLSGARLRSMLEKAWDAGMATEYWHDEARDLATRKRDVEAILAGETGRPTVDGAACLTVDELPVPERMSRYAAARGKTVDEVLADPDVVKAPDGDPAKLWERRIAMSGGETHVDVVRARTVEIERKLLEIGVTFRRRYRGGFGWVLAGGFLPFEDVWMLDLEGLLSRVSQLIDGGKRSGPSSSSLSAKLLYNILKYMRYRRCGLLSPT